MTGLIDTHTHLFCEEFDEDRELAVIRAVQAGVTRMYMPNIDETTIKPLMELCGSNQYCFPLMGLHPTSVDTEWENKLKIIEDVLKSGYVFYGIGEVGLDFYWDKSYASEQMLAFEKQIKWAIELDLPVMIHCRNAHSAMIEVLSNYKTTGLRGIFHSFGGNLNEAEELLDYENFMLGINGIVTFKKSSLPEVLMHIPLDRIVLETDSPYLSPVPHRGERNESANLVHIAEKLSQIYNVSLDVLAGTTSTNALKVFQIAK